VIAVYRGNISVPELVEDAAVGDWVDNWGYLEPGTYSVSFAEGQDHAQCERMQQMLGRDLIPDSVLIAW
jgi:hypothetical protein